MTNVLEPVTRPNGKLYRPRKVRGEVLHDEDMIESQILILGTHDIDRARHLATQIAFGISGTYTAETPYLGWWRLCMRDHQPWYEYDEIRGAAGVRFDICEP